MGTEYSVKEIIEVCKNVSGKQEVIKCTDYKVRTYRMMNDKKIYNPNTAIVSSKL